MAGSEPVEELQALIARLEELIAPYAGRVEYGNLRRHISCCEFSGEAVTNVALVYETPGGSTDQINIEFHPSSRTYSFIDADAGEIRTACLEEVLERVSTRVSGIPEKRRETLRAEIRRQIDAGSSHAGLVGHLNRMMQSDLIGGTITHLEMRDAIRYAVEYMRECGRQQPPA